MFSVLIRSSFLQGLQWLVTLKPQGSNGHAKSNENNIGQCDNDILCAKPIQSKKRWSRHTKASPPPPPPQQTKSNGILLKAPAPPPPAPSAPVPNPPSSSPEPPPLAPKGIRPVPVSSSMTSLRSSGSDSKKQSYNLF